MDRLIWTFLQEEHYYKNFYLQRFELTMTKLEAGSNCALFFIIFWQFCAFIFYTQPCAGWLSLSQGANLSIF